MDIVGTSREAPRGMTDVEVVPHAPQRMLLRWEHGGARYHIWFDPADVSLTPVGGTLYKRELGDTKLRVVKLRVAVPRNTAMLNTAVARAQFERLVERAQQGDAAKAAQEQERFREAARRAVKEKAGPQLYDLLERARKHLGGGVAAGLLVEVNHALDKVDQELSTVDSSFDSADNVGKE